MEAIKLAYDTSVIRLRCQFVPKIMHGGATEVQLEPQIDIYSVDATKEPPKNHQNKTNKQATYQNKILSRNCIIIKNAKRLH
jgi:hypothetical protein